MAATVPFSPYASTNASGSFGVSSVGYFQGMAMDNPAAMQFLNAGLLASTETLPMWGGVAVMAQIPVQGTLLGGIQRADTNADIGGFSVYTSDYAMVGSPQSTAPVTLNGGQVNYFELGSDIQLCVAIDPTLAATLQNGTTLQNVQVSWDLVNQKIITYSGAIGALPVKIINIDTANSLVVSYNSSTNVCQFASGAVALIQI